MVNGNTMIVSFIYEIFGFITISNYCFSIFETKCGTGGDYTNLVILANHVCKECTKFFHGIIITKFALFYSH